MILVPTLATATGMRLALTGVIKRFPANLTDSLLPTKFREVEFGSCVRHRVTIQ